MSPQAQLQLCRMILTMDGSPPSPSTSLRAKPSSLNELPWSDQSCPCSALGM